MAPPIVKSWIRHCLRNIVARAPSSFGNSVHSAAVANVTVKISKITKEIQVINFHLSRQKQAKTHVNRLKQSLNPKETQDRGGKNSFCAPSPHFLATPLLISFSHEYPDPLSLFFDCLSRYQLTTYKPILQYSAYLLSLICVFCRQL